MTTMNVEAPPKQDQLLMERICSIRSSFFSLRVDPHPTKIMKGDKNDIVAAPETQTVCVFIHHKAIIEACI